MWSARNAGTFSVSHNDASFSAQGSSFSSSGFFGEMGTESNGLFVSHDDGNQEAATASQISADSAQFVPSSGDLPLIVRSRRKHALQ